MSTQQKASYYYIISILVIFFSILLPGLTIAASEKQLKIVEIDYDAEVMTVMSTEGDTRLFYSDSKQKNWECAYGVFEDGKYEMDISWVKKTGDYTISLKGDKSDLVIQVTLPKQKKDFKVSFDCTTEQFKFSGDNGGTIFWRKKGSTAWQEFGKASDEQTELKLELERMYAKGASLYFRIGQEKGGTKNGAFDAGMRPSTEVSLNISKQAEGPKLSIAGDKTIAVNDKMEYRTADGNWIACDKKLDINEIAKAALAEEGVAQDVVFYVRVAATAKKLPSAQKEFTVLAQPEAPKNVEFAFGNNTSLKIEIKDLIVNDEISEEKPSGTNPYEFTVVAKDKELEKNAVWTKITAETAVISETKAPEGSKIYVRKRCFALPANVIHTESKTVEYTVPKYPEATEVGLVGEATEFAYLEEECVVLVKTENETPRGMQFLLKPDAIFDGIEIKTIECGSTALVYDTEKSANGIIVTIKDTSKYESNIAGRDKAYPIKITLKNGEVLVGKVKMMIKKVPEPVPDEEESNPEMDKESPDENLPEEKTPENGENSGDISDIDDYMSDSDEV